MERRFVKPLNLVFLSVIMFGAVNQVYAAKPPLPQYNEMGSFMVQPHSSGAVNVKSPELGSVNSTSHKYNSGMQVPSYHSPYSVPSVTQNTQSKKVLSSSPDSSLEKQEHKSVENSSVMLQPSFVTSDYSINKSADEQASNDKSTKKRKNSKILKDKFSPLQFSNFWNKFKINSIKVNSFKKRDASDSSSGEIVKDLPQTVFEAEQDYSNEKFVETSVITSAIPTPSTKNQQTSHSRKSSVPTPSLADTMISNNFYHDINLVNVEKSTKSTQPILQKNISETESVDSSSIEKDNVSKAGKIKSLKMFARFSGSSNNDKNIVQSKPLDSSINSESTITVNQSKTINNSYSLNDGAVKDDSFLGNKFKKDSSLIESEKSVSQDKLDAYEEVRDYAKVLYNANKLGEAVIEFNNIPDAHKISDDWVFLANIAQDNSKLDDAIFYLNKAIQLDDSNYKAHYNLGNVYLSQNKINSALSEYKKVNKIKKDFAYAYYNKGCCYLKTNNYFNARYEFGLAIKYNPEDPVFYYNLAYTNKMMKKEKKAQEALDIYNKLMNE